MKIKFNLYERVAGLFLLGAVVGTVGVTFAVMISKGVFDAKIPLETMLQTADGIREGTLVSMQGLRIGSVTSVELKSANEVLVRFKMSSQYVHNVRADSVVRVTRPFIIGEKVLEVSIGSKDAEQIVAGGKLVAEPTMDIMDLISGRTLGPYMSMFGKMADNLKLVAEAFLDPKRSQAIIRMFDDLSPLLKNASSLAKEANKMMAGMNKNQQLVTMVSNLAEITSELHKALPQIARESPEMLGHLSKIARNMSVLTDEIQKTLPMLQKMAPEIPRASERALEALDETVVTLKALQKSFLLSGNAKEVREEEAARAKAKELAREKSERERRAPAGDDKQGAPSEDESLK